MNRINKEIDFSSLKIDQLGYIYKDVHKQAEILETQMNLPKFTFIEDATHVIQQKNSEHEIIIKIGMSRFFNTQIELIQWVKGDCIFKDFIDSGQEGLQHISVFVDELDPYIEAYKRQNFELIHTGQIGKQRFAFFDTLKTFGIIIEFQETVKRRKRKVK